MYEAKLELPDGWWWWVGGGGGPRNNPFPEGERGQGESMVIF